ncbi:hypothetical protein CWI42_060950 [Ordospora colligata]|nr:hypothetical protein CWI42_060950 [Ordospora colligata]
MQMESSLFSYRNDDKITCAGFCAERIFASLPHTIVEWSRTERKIISVHEMNEEINSITCMNNECVALLSKNSVWLLLRTEIRYAMEKPSLCGVVVYNGMLMLIDQQSITSIYVQERNIKISRIRMENGNGMCTCGSEYENGLLLAYENGNVIEICTQVMIDIIDGKLAEVDNKHIKTLICLREPVISVGVLNNLLVVALFNKKMLTMNLKSGETSYTELAYEVKFSTLWNGMIVVSDSKGNIILMDKNLKIAYSKCMRDEVCSLGSNGVDLIVGFSTGTVKECKLNRFGFISIHTDMDMEVISMNANRQIEVDNKLQILCNVIKYI